MELQVQKKQYRCTNFGSCSKANSQEIIELLPNEKAVCPEDAYPLTALEKGKTILERGVSWLKDHPGLVAMVVAILILVPGGFFGYRFYRDRTPVDVGPPSPSTSGVGLKYPDDTLAQSRKDAAKNVVGPGGDAAISAAKKAAAQELVNSAVGFMQKGQLSKADEQLGKALAENPDDVLAYLNRAIIRAREKRSEEALANFDQALKKGFKDLALLDRDTDFRVVRSLPGYREVLAKNGVKL